MGGSWSPNSTDLYFWYLFVELAVVTPVERRNFVSVVPAAKKSKLGPIFLKNIRVMYILSVKKQKTGQKTGKNPPKRTVFSAPPTSWLSLDRFWPGQNPFEQILTRSKSVRTDFDRSKSVQTVCLNRFWPVKTRSNRFWPGQNPFERILTGSKSVQTEPAGRGGWKIHLFWRVFARFLSCFLLFHWQFVYGMPFLQKKSVQLTFSSHRSTIYKVPPRIGGHHFLLCQQTNTKDIAGQSANCC